MKKIYLKFICHEHCIDTKSCISYKEGQQFLELNLEENNMRK